jgi:hypothetical protein
MVETAASVSEVLAPAGRRRWIAVADCDAADPGVPWSTTSAGTTSGRRKPWQWRPIDDIAAALHGEFDGIVWRCRCPAHADDVRALSLGDRDGALFMCCAAGCGARTIAVALYRRGLWPDDGPRRPWRWRRRPAPIPRHARRDYARKLWRVCQPAIGTLGETYLRGLGISHPVPVAFRFATQLEHWPTGAAFPALVCAMQDATGRFSGVQQIFLDGPALAPVSPAKVILGEPGVIRLAAPDDVALTVATDVETALLLSSADRAPPVWACATPKVLRRLDPPPPVRQVNLALRQNAIAPVLRQAAITLTERLLDDNRTVRWFEPPLPTPMADEAA